MKKEEFVAKRIYRNKTIRELQKKEMLLGSSKINNLYKFLNRRLLIALILFIVCLFLKHGVIIAPLVVVFFHIISEKIYYDYRIKKRCEKLEDDAIFFFEILSLTLESNKNLKASLELTINNIDSELANEFKNALNEVKLGKSFSESLIAMKERIPSESINNIILNLTESSIYGTNILDTLNNQLEYLREKKTLAIKAEINKLPTKISIISVLFFIPIMLLIILSPVLINFLLK